MFPKLASPAAAVLLAGCAAALATAPKAAEPMGQRPSYLTTLATQVPNEAAIGRRIYVPGLEDDWVPQGFTIAEGELLVSSYKPTPDIKADAGPCRVFRIDPASGKTVGQFDVPLANCNSHAGGMAYLGNGRLVLSDTWMLSIIDLPKALAAGTAEGAIRTVKIDKSGGLRGSFAGGDGADAWIGHWSRDAGKSRAFKLPADFFDRHQDATVDDKATVASMPVPVEAQGLAFDKAGNVWTTSSRSNKMSKIYKLDRAGKVLAEYEAPIGMEGIAFDASGRLWGMTESGTRKYLRWGDEFNFPFVFEIDVAKLK
jgi:hypothetical protein